MIQAVIFDLDGTLLNTIQDLADSCNKTLSQLNFPERSLHEIKTFVGNGIAHLIEKAIPNGKDNKNYEKAVFLIKEIYSKNYHNKTKPYDGIMDLLKELKQHGIKIGINSNKPDAQVKELTQLYFSNYIDCETAIGEKDGIQRKPFPDIANEIIKTFNIQKENIIYIGDSEVDIETALNANLKCISVTWGFRNKKELKENGAKIIVDKPKEILDFILTHES